MGGLLSGLWQFWGLRDDQILLTSPHLDCRDIIICGAQCISGDVKPLTHRGQASGPTPTFASWLPGARFASARIARRSKHSLARLPHSFRLIVMVSPHMFGTNSRETHLGPDMLGKFISVPQIPERNSRRHPIRLDTYFNYLFSGSECQRLGSPSRHNSPIQSQAIFEGVLGREP